MSPLSILFVGPSLFVMLAARYLAARALGMRGITLFGGAIQNAEAATPARRAGVVLAALVASYLVAGVCFAASAVVAGKTVRTTEISVIPGKAAAAAGMLSGDRLLEAAGRPVHTWDELADEISRHAGEPIAIVAQRGDEEVRFTVAPVGERGHGKIGVAAATGGATHARASAGDVLGGLLVMPAQCFTETARGLAHLLAGSDEQELAGPVAIVKEGAKASSAGYGVSFFFLVLAATLANVWPLCALVAIAMVPRRAGGRPTEPIRR